MQSLFRKPRELFARRLAGQFPQPVVGVVLIDTGASNTCISQRVAERLNLKPLRIADGLGAGGTHRNPVYVFVQLQIGFGDAKTGLAPA